MALQLQCQSLVLDARPRYPFLIPVKRYWCSDHHFTGPASLTFICAHAVSFSKEHWEPTIQHIYEHLTTQPRCNVEIREFWAVDAPKHGMSAIVNDGLDDIEGEKLCPWDNYSRSIHVLLSGMARGVDVDFGARRIVGLGHSMGAHALILTHGFMPSYAFESLILVEPVLVPRPHPSQRFHDLGWYIGTLLSKFALKRRDIWANKAEALQSLRTVCGSWDPAVLNIFVEHNLRQLPTSKYPRHGSGLTLSCTREDEAACSLNPVERDRCYNYFGILCKQLPVHLIFGDSSLVAPDHHINAVIEVGSSGHHASFTRMAGVGHLVPQVQPLGLAHAIVDRLVQDAAADGRKSRSRL